jgi:hypothetical protein
MGIQAHTGKSISLLIWLHKLLLWYGYFWNTMRKCKKLLKKNPR